MSELLEKTRRINRFIQESARYPVDFKEMAQVLSDELAANVYVVSKKGKVLGYGFVEGFDCETIESCVSNGSMFPKEYNDRLLRVVETIENSREATRKCFLSDAVDCPFEEKVYTIVPVYCGGERLATLVLARFDGDFSDDDVVLAEYAATVIGMEIMRSKNEKIEGEARKKAAVQMALDTLSYSEQEAVEHIFDELNGDEGLLVASKIADKVGITRSVIVNALRKFESAGVIESRSLGMKGTYIRVLNDKLFDELERLRSRQISR
ncbi:MAG: GTP-sensing pleiotropic transcriptional regulator CodY [Firmicutes bacterium]|nr:GTP-sensing pleiotropic transcriptional regulator CodY [Bacillota bacterium]